MNHSDQARDAAAADHAGSVRFIALYLPQFHPVPQNDAWWGKGFTEWTNVTKAVPLFRDHYQPHLPADLGFCDLRCADVRQAQAEMARDYGLAGFCYYHYWFGGERLLERPFNEVLASGSPDFPFCLCWANETWSRRWLGEERDILIAQTYNRDDDRRHGEWLAAAFADPRYIRVEGRPLFLVYRPKDLPHPQETLEAIRLASQRHGLPNPYLVGVDAHSPGQDFTKIGFDTTMAFSPQLGALPDFNNDRPSLTKWRRNAALGIHSASLKVYDDIEARRLMAARQRDFAYIPTVHVGWDNSARRGKNGVVVVNSAPETFAAELDAQARAVLARSADPVVFVNAWNEWAEGNHLEPDQKHGLRFLESLRGVAERYR